MLFPVPFTLFKVFQNKKGFGILTLPPSPAPQRTSS